MNLSRKSFLASLLGLFVAPFVKLKKEPEPYSFANEDVGPWLKRCGGCGDFFPDTVRVVHSRWVARPGYETAAYSHGNRVCIIQEPILTPGYYTFTSSVSCGQPGSFQGLPETSGYVKIG